MPYISLDEIIERQIRYYPASGPLKSHKTGNEDITPWANYLLDALTEQTERARGIMESDRPEKLLSEKQMKVYRLFDGEQEMGVAEIAVLLKDRVKRETIKQALSRLVKLRILERLGQTRGSRYKSIK